MEKPRQLAEGAHEPDKVGYANPPVETRFKSGQSGNPKGRPRGAKGRKATVIRILMEKRKVDTQGTGRPREITVLELTVLLLKQLAATGDQKAFRTLIDLDRRHGSPEPGKPVGYLVVPEVRDETEWLEMVELMRSENA